MSGGKPRSVAELLKTGGISKLKAEAAERRELADQVRSVLPADEAEHVVSARLDESGRLVVGMDTAAWAARLRYSLPELLGKPVRVRVTVPPGAPDRN